MPLSSSHSTVFALVGHPNTGKTTLFNALTGLRQKTGNYAGVTVEKKQGIFFSQHGKPMTIIDLPGSYSLYPRSPDEAITRDVLLGLDTQTPPLDGILAIVNPSNLARQLYFLLQLLELGTPITLVINSISSKWEPSINIEKLEQILKIPVLLVNANQPKTLLKLRVLLSKPLQKTTPQLSAECTPLLPIITTLSHYLCNHYNLKPPYANIIAFLAITDLSNYSIYKKDKAWQNMLEANLEPLRGLQSKWIESIATSRHDKSKQIADAAFPLGSFLLPNRLSVTEAIDNIVLHPWAGGILLVSILSGLFYTIFYLAEFPKEWIEIALEHLSLWITNNMSEGILRSLITDGMITGCGSVLAFLPQILLLFFGIGLLESSGYLSRAAFILDRPMQRVGLQGKSFIPFLSSYACAIPGIMATRMIDAPADRLATIIVAPWASCSARLPVYLILISLLNPVFDNSPSLKAITLFGLYALGTLSAFLLAWALRKTLIQGDSYPLIMELPAYQSPKLRHVILEVWQRGKSFVMNAGTLILGLSIIMWYTLSHPILEGASTEAQLLQSYASKVGQFIEPILKPLGFDWKIAIGLIASFAAREVFVSTMAIIYCTHEGPWMTPLTALSLLIFYVYAMQCMSTLAVVRRETGSWKWPIFQLLAMTATAYLGSLMVFQIGTYLGFQ